MTAFVDIVSRVAVAIFALFPSAVLSYSLHPRPLASSSQRLRAISSRTSDNAKSSSDSFSLYTRMLQRCVSLSSRESEFLLNFWNADLNCFSIVPQKNDSSSSPPRASITSTCLSIETMLENREHWKKVASWDDEGSAISVSKVVKRLMDSAWSGDSFQTPILVQTLCKLRAVDKNDVKFADAVDTVISQRSQLSLHRKQPNSAYLRFQNVRALLRLVDNDMVPLRLVGSGKVGYALERANLVAGDELSRQLSFYHSDDSANFDVIVLLYSLLAYWESSQSLFLSAFARGVVPPTNMKLVASALDVVFEQQKTDGTWYKGEPIYRQGGRDIGNSYVFFYDAVGAILSSGLPASMLSKYLVNFERCLTWAENNISEEMLPEVCDPLTGRCMGQTVRGWRSNHLDTGGAVCWCTAQVFFAVGSGEGGLGGLLKRLITTHVLDEFGGVAGPQAGAAGSRGTSRSAAAAVAAAAAAAFPATARKSTAVAQLGMGGGGGDMNRWNALMDTDIKFASRDTTTLKAVVRDHFLQPQLVKQQALECALTSACEVGLGTESGFRGVENQPPLYSCILFGPPGTAKTTICSAMASFLGWNFVTIDTARFLSNGLENVASTMSNIFEKLGSLERTIILFDEVEEFCLDRENSAIGMESRLLTTAMLTQLNGLRSKQKCIFIVATNRLRSFDAAVTRPGRFDALLFVGTPNMESRVRRLGERLPAATAQQVIDSFKSVLAERWDGEARFCSFAENEALINFAREEARSPSIDSAALKAKLGNKLDGLLRTATIQGQVREEYVASESLSRL